MEAEHQAAKPLQSVSASQFAHLLRSDTDQHVDQSPEAAENRKMAAAELSAIFALRDNPDFQWFMQTFIDEPYRKAFGDFRDPNTAPDKLVDIRTRYIALREIKTALLEREIAHRELISPGDEEIVRLRERLALL